MNVLRNEDYILDENLYLVEGSIVVDRLLHSLSFSARPLATVSSSRMASR